MIIQPEPPTIMDRTAAPPIQRPIFKQGLPLFWSFFPMGVFVGAVAGWIKFSNTGSLLEALSLGVPVILGIAALAIVLGYIKARKTVAILYLEDAVLKGRWQTVFGQGESFEVPFSQTTNWRWFDSGNRRNYVTVMVEFSHGGRVYRLPTYGARIVDLDALRALAPTVIDEAKKASPDLLRSVGVR